MFDKTLPTVFLQIVVSKINLYFVIKKNILVLSDHVQPLCKFSEITDKEILQQEDTGT